MLQITFCACWLVVFFGGGGGKGDVDENDRVCHEFVEQGCPSAIGMDRHVK